jgi:hypothetical protein
MFDLAALSSIYEEECNDDDLVCWPIHFLLLAVCPPAKACGGEALGMFDLAALSSIYEECNDDDLVCWPIHFLLLEVCHIFPGIVATI